MDINQENLDISKKRLNEIPENKNIVDVHFVKGFHEVPQEIDLCINATTANVRASVTRELISHLKVKFILFEKVLFQSVSEYEQISKLLSNNNILSWVNCSRRLQIFYSEIKRFFKNDEKIIMTVLGGHWGMGCNSIHYIDLFSYLNNNYSIEIFNQLDNIVLPSKRENFVEFSGSLICKQSNGSELFLHSKSNVVMPITLEILSDNIKIFIDEFNRKSLISRRENNWIWEIKDFEILNQSDMSGFIAEDILINGSCNLISFEKSCLLHIPFINTLVDHLNNLNYKTINGNCPIT